MFILKNKIEAFEWFRKKNVMIIPTDTVYGLAARANEDSEVLQIYRVKNRNTNNPLIVHFFNIEQIKEYCFLSEQEEVLLKRFAPGPITLLLKKKNTNYFAVATNKSQYVCARIPKHSFCFDFIQNFGPIAAPSANISGLLTLTNYQMIEDQYKNLSIGVYLNDEEIGGIESTIIHCVNNVNKDIKILRTGLVSHESLKAFGNVIFNEKKDYYIPGNYFKHYQIKKELIIENKEDYKKNSSNKFRIDFGDNECHFNLSVNNNPKEIMRNFFYSLYLGDQSIFNIVSINKLSDDFLCLHERLLKTLEK